MNNAIFYHAGCPVCVSAEQALLAALDQQRNQWQQQLTAFQQQVQTIKQLQLSADEEQKQIDLQLQQAFPPEQHLRVKALSGLL